MIVALVVWSNWNFGPGSITSRALAVAPDGTLHFAYLSNRNGNLIHAWLVSGRWVAETLGVCSSPPVLRIDKDGGLHILSGTMLTYWYRAPGSGTWQIVVSNCLTGEYDLWVGDSVIVGFRTSSAVYKAVVSDTGFRVTLIDSSYYYYGQPYNIIYTICGPVVTFSGKVLYGSQKGYTPGKINVCMYCYGHSGVDLEYYDSFDCGASVIDATVQGDLLAYQFDDGDGSYLRVYPLEDTIFGRYSKVGLWVYEPYYFLSLIDWNNFLYIARNLMGSSRLFRMWLEGDAATGSPTSIAAVDTSKLYVAFVDTVGNVRVVEAEIRSSDNQGRGEWEVIKLLSSVTKYYLRLFPLIDGEISLSLYGAEGNRVFTATTKVKAGELTKIPLPRLGPGVYFLQANIGPYTQRFRVIII